VFFNANISTEEFNSIVATQSSHATVALSWMATIVQNSMKRVAVGQHFVQLHNLYESGTCPGSATHPKFRLHMATPMQRISEFALKNGSERYGKGNDIMDTAVPDEEYWESNEYFVGKRCLLEDETFVLAMKA